MSEIVKIFDISHRGAGVGKIDGKVVFVPKTLVGEKVAVEFVNEKSHFVDAILTSVEKASDERIPAKCPYFDICGGCDFQHTTYENEVKIKTQILKRELAKVGFDGELEFVKAPLRFEYRNKIKLEVFENKIGYFKPKSHQFFSIDVCPIASKSLESTFLNLKRFLALNNFEGLKCVYLKKVDGQVAICFLFNKHLQKNAKNLIDDVKNIQILNGYCVFFAFGEVLESNSTKVLKVAGDGNLCKKFKNFEMQVDVSAFNQINDEVAEKLYACILQNAAEKKVINAYSGQGLLTKLLCESAEFVYGIEFQRSAHESAEKFLAAEQKVQNFCGKVENILPQLLKHNKADLIVLDPAREGCEKEVTKCINAAKIPEVLYVSCNFASLVRDLGELLKNYEILQVKIFDMFPCTKNMETVVLLKLKS